MDKKIVVLNYVIYIIKLPFRLIQQVFHFHSKDFGNPV